MIDSDKKQQLIEEFCQFIEELPESTVEFQMNSDNTADLLTLCQEFIALKTEIKQESRQFKTALESFKDVFNTLQNSHDLLSKELAERRQNQSLEIEKQQIILLKPLLLELIDLRDRLEISSRHFKTYRPKGWARLFKREQQLIGSIAEGQDMTLRRVDQLLSNYGVEAVDTKNQYFDPQSMRAVAVEHHPDRPNSVVISEIQKGFCWQNQILRIAEVKVNKIEG